MTVDQFIEKRRDEMAKDKVACAKQKAENDAYLADLQKRADEQKAAADEKHQKLMKIEADFDAQEKQLDADYRPRIKAIDSDRTLSTRDRVNQSSALTRELADKRQELFNQKRDAEKKVSEGN